MSPGRTSPLVTLCLLVLVPLFVPLVQAQEAPVLSVGDAAIDVSRITPGTQHYRLVRASESEEQEMGTVQTTLETYEHDGEAGLLYILAQQLPRITMTDSLLLRPSTLAPRWYRNRVPGFQDIALDYGPEHRVVGMYESGDEPTDTIDVQMEAARFDFTFSSQLARTLPLREGFAARLPVFHYQEGVAFVTVRVVGAEVFPYTDDATDAWLVAIESPSGRSSVHWIAKETREHLGWKVEVQPGVEMRQVKVMNGAG